MDIVVIDQAPDLFWYISGALREDELSLKHIPLMAAAEGIILQDMPKIVVVNGDEGTSPVNKFISKMRNHVFARNAIFIVVTSNSDVSEKRTYIVSGAGFVLYRSAGQSPPPKFFQNLIKWFMNIKNPEQNIFEYKITPFKSEGEWTTYGRIGWISPTHMLIENNLALEPGETIDFNCPLFEELGIKQPRLQCVERNKVGRYYQYANSLLCKISSKSFEKDQKRLTAWIAQNQKVSKNKSATLYLARYSGTEILLPNTRRAGFTPQSAACLCRFFSTTSFSAYKNNVLCGTPIKIRIHNLKVSGLNLKVLLKQQKTAPSSGRPNSDRVKILSAIFRLESLT
jgi:hypothetical protein